MSRRSLNQSIFRLIVGIVVVTVLTILANVWITMTGYATQRLERELKVAQNVLERVLRNREFQLFNSADILASDFGFKQAVATREKETITSVLKNHGERISADVMALISLEGNIIASSPELNLSGDIFPDGELIRSVVGERGAVATMVLNNHLYQVVMLTVDAPGPIAIALIGFRFDLALVNELKELTRLETTITVERQGEQRIVISTLPDQVNERVLPQERDALWWFKLLLLGDDQYVSRYFSFDAVSGSEVKVTLSEDVHDLSRDFGRLLLNISLIALVAIVLALVFASLFSRVLARPLKLLANFAQHIARGDYNQTVSAPSNLIEFDSLASALDSMQENIRDREEKIVYQANHDELTGLLDRHRLSELIDDKFNRGDTFSVVCVNILGFRNINDVFGFQNGDICLKVLAQRLASLEGISARLGGGEMVWVPESHTELNQLNAVKRLLEVSIDTGTVSIDPKVVIGIIHCPEHASTTEDIFRRINIVLDEAVLNKSFLLTYRDEMEQRYLRRLTIVTELKRALRSRQRELSIVYQPKLDIGRGEIAGAEALIRWNNAELGFVPPDEFIAVAEGAGIIEQITDWVIDRVIDDLRLFSQRSTPLKIAINLSAKDIMNPHLANDCARRLSRAGLESGLLSFEITEGDMVKDAEAAIEHLQRFRDEGFGLAIDDFGTGYSSMAYLQRFPVDTLKIDKAFVLNLRDRAGDQKIVKTIINLAHGFDMNIVAEGVEDAASLSLLKQWGCEYAQGFLICKPVSAQGLCDWIEENSNTDWSE